MATTYVVFMQKGEGFVVFAEVPARGSREAIKAALSETENFEAGTYVAVPKRSWSPETVAPKQAFSFS